jgi:hypothetical protein
VQGNLHTTSIADKNYSITLMTLNSANERSNGCYEQDCHRKSVEKKNLSHKPHVSVGRTRAGETTRHLGGD